MLPTAEQLNPYGDPDGDVAEAHFLGRTREQAYALFVEAPLVYQEDLMWMGTVAFAFYFPAFSDYLRSDGARGDSDAVAALAALVEHRLDHDADGVLLARDAVRETLVFVCDRFDRYDVDPALHGDLRERLGALAERLA